MTGGCSGWSARVRTSHPTPARARFDASARTHTFMPPPSPEPGCASGEVCTLSIATRRTDMARRAYLRAQGPLTASAGLGGADLFRPLLLERAVDVDQRLLVALAD